MTYENMVEELQKGVEEVRETVDIVFQEGITIIESAKKLEEAGVLGSDISALGAPTRKHPLRVFFCWSFTDART